MGELGFVVFICLCVKFIKNTTNELRFFNVTYLQNFTLTFSRYQNCCFGFKKVAILCKLNIKVQILLIKFISVARLFRLSIVKCISKLLSFHFELNVVKRNSLFIYSHYILDFIYRFKRYFTGLFGISLRLPKFKFVVGF